MANIKFITKFFTKFFLNCLYICYIVSLESIMPRIPPVLSIIKTHNHEKKEEKNL